MQKFDRRPSPKQRGLFSVRDASQETQLENRLNRPSKLRNNERKHHVNKVCCVLFFIDAALFMERRKDPRYSLALYFSAVQ